jgi:ribosomal protein L18
LAAVRQLRRRSTIGEFTSGPSGGRLTTIATARDHMAQYAQAFARLKNGDIQGANTLAAQWGRQTGNPNVVSVDAMGKIVADETANASAGQLTGSAAGDRDRAGSQPRIRVAKL